MTGRRVVLFGMAILGIIGVVFLGEGFGADI